MSARKIQNEAEARECIAKMKESGLTSAQWARSAGIDGRSLHAWNVNLARGSAGFRPRAGTARGTQRMKLVELVPVEVPSSASRYVVRVGQLALEVDVKFDEGTLRRLIAVLRSC